jgi:hypothetical protein
MRQFSRAVIDVVKPALFPCDPRLVRVPWGVYRGICMRIDFTRMTQFYLGLHEAETNYVIRSMLRSAKWLIDIGSGDGELSILFKLRSNCVTFAIDPEVRSYSMQENLIANGIDPATDITVIRRCVGTKFLPMDDIPVSRSETGFVKIDVEGSELDVLRSGYELLSCKHCSLLIETHSKELEAACIEYLADLGYHCEVICNAWWRKIIPEQRTRPHNRWLFAEPGTVPI